MMKSIRKTGGFTLIELLVVIAIIGILSSVVLASLNSARAKGRDARRLADVKQLQLALELYHDAENQYPATTSVAALVTPGYIAAIPTDPTDGSAYPYAGIGSAATCTSFHLGATLEDADHNALNGDIDYDSSSTECTAADGEGFDGADPIYDIRP